MSVRQPRVRDRGDGAIRFTSAILPRYLRRAKSWKTFCRVGGGAPQG